MTRAEWTSGRRLVDQFSSSTGVSGYGPATVCSELVLSGYQQLSTFGMSGYQYPDAPWNICRSVEVGLYIGVN